MPRKAWTVTVEGKDHPVELSWFDSWESLKLEVDGRKVKSWFAYGLWNSDSHVDFKVAGITIKIFRTWELSVLEDPHPGSQPQKKIPPLGGN